MKVIFTYIASFMYDIEGKKSSKRLCGMLLIAFGLLMSFSAVMAGLFFAIQDKEMIIRIIDAQYIAGAGLLGVSIFEGANRGKKNVRN